MRADNVDDLIEFFRSWDGLKFFRDSTPAVIMAVFGGFVSIVANKKNLTVKASIGGLFTAALVGIIVHSLLVEAGASANVSAATLAMSGYCSRRVLEILEIKFLKKIEKGDGDV